MGFQGNSGISETFSVVSGDYLGFQEDIERFLGVSQGFEEVSKGVMRLKQAFSDVSRAIGDFSAQ